MTGINNGTMDLMNLQFTAKAPKNDKAADDFAGFKTMLKGKNREREDAVTPDTKEDSEPAIEAAAAAMGPVEPPAQVVEPQEEEAGQELVVDALISNVGEAVLDPQISMGDQKMEPIYQTLDQLRLQQMLAKTEEPVSPELEQGPEVMVQTAEEPVIVQTAEKPVIVQSAKSEEKPVEAPENQFSYHMEKTEKKAVQPMQKEEPVVTMSPQGLQPVDNQDTGHRQISDDGLKEQTKLTSASAHKTEAKLGPVQNDEKTPEESISVFQEKSSEPVSHVKTGKETTVYTTMKADTQEKLETKLPEHILRQIQTGKKELNIQLEPGNLGKIQIKVSYEDNQVSVSVLCTESKTLRMLSQSAGEIGTILEANLERPVQILVDKQENDYLNNQEHQDQGRQRQEQESRQQQEQSSEDFLQKLRLGIVDAETISYDFADYR